MKKSPNPIDKHVGSRVRLRRMLIGMSQEKLGEALGLTFQQVQKYEKGTNRIGASRLHEIARILGVGIDYFYEGAPSAGDSDVAENPGSNDVATILSTSDSVQLMKAFARIKDAKVRKRIVDLAEALACVPE